MRNPALLSIITCASLASFALAANGPADKTMSNDYNAPTTTDTMSTGASATTQNPQAAQAPVGKKLTDAEIANILMTANQLDAEGGKTASKKSTTPAVKSFAQQMVNDHTTSNQKTKELAKSLSITPKASADSKALKAEHDASMKKLSKLKGKAFDMAYIDNEVAMHQKVLDTIDQKLLPNATDAALKEHLTSTRSVIVGHLEHAKRMQSGDMTDHSNMDMSGDTTPKTVAPTAE